MGDESREAEKSPGEMVREARRSLGLSLADVAAMTRIPKAMLRHLEEDRYDEYSAEVFARGHLRNYAREVQLEPEQVLKAFDRRTGRLGETSSNDVAESSETGGMAKEAALELDLQSIRRRIRPAHLVAAGLGVVALIFLFSLLGGSQATAQDPNEFPETDEAGAATSTDLGSEEETDKSRWLLEKPDESGRSDEAE